MSGHWVVGAAVLTLAGCTSVPAGLSGARLTAAIASRRLIVVTVANEPVPLESAAGSTPRPYRGFQHYGLSRAAREVVAALAKDYGLKQVTAWPIATLRVHCIVFEIPPGASRAVMLARLLHESRVELAEPLNTFRTMAQTYRDLQIRASPLTVRSERTGAQALP
jgi:hypothetical protein